MEAHVKCKHCPAECEGEDERKMVLPPSVAPEKVCETGTATAVWAWPTEAVPGHGRNGTVSYDGL